MKMDEYLKTLSGQIRCKKARGMVEKEIRHHMEDQRDALVSAGMGAEESEAAAVSDMGDPVEAGIALDRIHRPKMAWGIMLLILVLNIIGTVVMLAMQYESGTLNRVDMTRQIFFAGLGYVVMLGVCYLDYSFIGRWAKEIMVILWAGLVVGRIFFGRQMNGATRWIGVGGININILMILLLFVPLFGAVVYSYRHEGYRALWKCFLWMALPVLTAVGSSGITIAGMLFFTLMITLSVAVYNNWFYVSRKRTLIGIWGCLLGLPAVGGAFLLSFGPVYQAERIKAFVNPLGSVGYQVRVIRDILGKSQMLGRGSGDMNNAPDSSDFIMTYIVAYYGYLAAAVLVGLMMFLLLRLLNMVMKQKNQLGMIMGVGCATVFLTEVVLYMLGNLGIFQVSGFCPFFTSGSSAVMVTSVLLGIMLSIYRYQNVIPPTVKRGRRIRIVVER